ncbi:UNVERIFIED_CONTAM: hypothetical protein Slati_2254300, partial [Sesamum latifolium]
TKKLRSKRLKKKFGLAFDQNDGLNASKHEAGDSHDCELKENEDVTEASCQRQRDTKVGEHKEISQHMEPQEVGDGNVKDWERENGECKDMMVVRDDVKNTILLERKERTQRRSRPIIFNQMTPNVFVLSNKDHSQEEMMVIVDSLKNRGVVGDDETHSAENVCDHIQLNDSTIVCESDSESKKVNAIVIRSLYVTLPMDTQSKSKSKKRTLEKKETSKPKISKLEVESSSATSICNMEQNEGKLVVYEPHEEKAIVYKQDNVTEKRCEAQSLPNGLIIEELAKTDPHGKLALRGRKVRIHFTGMLKESGVVFGTSVGKNPCKFRLGDEEIMDGFNMGIDGMIQDLGISN